MTAQIDSLRMALADFDRLPRHGSLAQEEAAREVIAAARRVVEAANRNPYPARA